MSCTRKSNFVAIQRRFARLESVVEDLGFDYLLVYYHVLGAVHADRTPPLTGPYSDPPAVVLAELGDLGGAIGASLLVSAKAPA